MGALGLSLRRGGGGRGRRHAGVLLGGKGANLAEMAAIGLPVPPGFTITTALCNSYYDAGAHAARRPRRGDRGRPRPCREHCRRRLRRPRPHAAGLGAFRRPRVHARHDGHGAQSRPQRRDRGRPRAARAATPASPTTATAASSRCTATWCSASRTAPSRSCWSGRRRPEATASTPTWRPATGSASSPAYKALVRDETGQDFPQDARAQLAGAIRAVLDSWMNARAVTYRRLHGIPADWGTAVTVQAMVFGNMGDDCATGVAFTRDPVHRGGHALRRVPGQRAGRGRGGRHPHAARGERGGARRQRHRGDRRWSAPCPGPTPCLQGDHGVSWSATTATCRTSSSRCSAARSGFSRPARASAPRKAALKIAVDMAREGLVSEAEALARVDPLALEQLLHPTLDPAAPRQVLARGLPASPGAASRQGRLRRRRGRGPGRTRRGRDPAAHRDQPRGHPRHARCSGGSSPAGAA